MANQPMMTTEIHRELYRRLEALRYKYSLKPTEFNQLLEDFTSDHEVDEP